MLILFLDYFLKYYSPATGDDSKPWLYGIIAGVMLIAGIVFMIISRRRHSSDDDNDE
ncbi:MAG: LPXTG cell wall anchor domain-containing protein [Clostridia bacterium]|nr:LPXTG cell wall anchor domain-containing protein [Clostridia bacterium]